MAVADGDRAEWEDGRGVKRGTAKRARSPREPRGLDESRELRALGPGLRRRADTSVTLANRASDDEFSMHSSSHSAARGYEEGLPSQPSDDDEQDLSGFPSHESDTCDDERGLSGGANRCVVCKVDMGACNGRQYCYKTHCGMLPISHCETGLPPVSKDAAH